MHLSEHYIAPISPVVAAILRIPVTKPVIYFVAALILSILLAAVPHITTALPIKTTILKQTTSVNCYK